MAKKPTKPTKPRIVRNTGCKSAKSEPVRGFLRGAFKRRLGIDVISEKGADGVRRYFVAPLKR